MHKTNEQRRQKAEIRRQNILKLIKENPGITCPVLCETVDLHPYTINDHLRILVDRNQVKRTRDKSPDPFRYTIAPNCIIPDDAAATGIDLGSAQLNAKWGYAAGSRS